MDGCKPALGLVLLGVLASASAYAHHSVAGNYDLNRTAMTEGELVSVSWSNPHIHFTLRAVDANGAEQEWQLDTNSVSVLSRLGLSADVFEIGEHVKVFGNVGKRNEHSLWTTNMLLSSGREVLLDARAKPHWSDRTVGAPTHAAVAADSGDLGIFRVWTSVGGGAALWNASYPLTPAARAQQAAWDPVADDPTKNCAPKGMPLMMEQPYPMQFVDQGDVILMRLEEYDATRRIGMRPEAGAEAAPAPSLYGRSMGHWEGDRTLVVETSAIDYPWFDKTGIRQSNAVRTEERFTLNADGSRLDYRLTVTDPATFTEPVVLSKSWEWRPGEMIRPYNCVP